MWNLREDNVGGKDEEGRTRRGGRGSERTADESPSSGLGMLIQEKQRERAKAGPQGTPPPPPTHTHTHTHTLVHTVPKCHM